MILTLNAGSSSIKFALYHFDTLEQIDSGLVERIGEGDAAVLKAGGEKQALGAADHAAAVSAILTYLDDPEVTAVGHRVVHGGADHAAPAVISDAVYEDIQALVKLAPLHQPHNLAAIDAARARFPKAVQVACFDTAFHRTQPEVADTFAIPLRYHDQGIRRYGFHGLSYTYISNKLKVLHPKLHHGRVIVAHLGNGASMCAIKNGKSIGSTMGFTALDGIPMGTRSGQIDPGVLLHLLDEGMSSLDLSTMLYKESGLLGLSGTSADMRDLLASEAPEARAAIDHYCFRIRREIGALSAELEGLDALIFCGGVGENAAPVRAGILEGMDWLGLSVDQKANEDSAASIGAGPVPVLVIPTDEELVIAGQTAALAHNG